MKSPFFRQCLTSDVMGAIANMHSACRITISWLASGEFFEIP
ncbi:hypothetical protein AB1L42_04990 [Thalassoglobus sp. JC818]